MREEIFQNDNALNHTAAIVKSSFEERENEIKYLPWPDLNITEPLWSILENKVGSRVPLSAKRA